MGSDSNNTNRSNNRVGMLFVGRSLQSMHLLRTQHRADNNSNLNSNTHTHTNPSHHAGDSSSSSADSSESEAPPAPPAQGRANAKALPKVKALPKALSKAEASRDPEYLQAIALFQEGRGPCLRAKARRRWPDFRAKSSAAQLVLVQRGRWKALAGLPSPPLNDLDAIQGCSLTMAYARALNGRDEDDLCKIFTHPEWVP